MRDISEIIVDGDMGELEDAIKKGADVNEIYTDSENQTPLFYSSYEQSKLLIAAGADVNHVNNYNQNALFFLNNSFCHNRDGEDEPQIINIEKKIKLLVENNINLNHIDNIGENFLFNININIETVKICEKFNADFNYINNKGENLFFWLNDYYKIREIREYLIEKGLDLFKENNDGENLLFIENGAGNPELIDYYLEKGLDINKKNNMGQTALMKIKSEQVKRFLIDKNIDIHTVNHKGENALDYCFDSEEMVKMLLSKNIDILQNPDFYKRNPRSSEMIEQKRMDYLLEKVNNEKKNLEKILENSVLQKNQTIKKRI